ncbi:transposase, partial [Weizmannia sp. CD-2023]|nr:transposase [Weizmannia sp. CD-2023]
AALLSKMGYTEKERVQVKLEFLRMLARMELDPAKMRLLYGFFDYYLKLNEKEEAEVMENIKMLDPDEAEQVLKLPNSYFDRGYKKGKEEGREEGEERLRRFIVNLLKNQVDVKVIAQASGLSEDEIMKIKRQIEGEKP